jgi:hypothetical protein
MKAIYAPSIDYTVNMPYDAPQSLLPSANPVEADWRAFRDYICKPYRDNPARLPKIQNWFDDLYACRKAGKTELGYHLITDQPTGRTYNAFSLNQQMYFSQDAAVLMLPHFSQADTAPMNASRFVGVLLADISRDDVKLAQIYEQNLPRVKNDKSDRRTQFSYLRSTTMDRLEAMAVAAGLNGLRRREQETFRVAKAQPVAGERHKDIGSPAFPWGQQDWFHGFVHTFRGTGTTYYLGANETIAVTLPEGFTTTHINFNMHKNRFRPEWGVLHNATPDAGGRAVLLGSLGPKSRPDSSPSRWQIQPAKLTP